jgi:DNA-binding winged helix-turn-helix (wHTH) protein/tetratricopeptide (TPR) repeat protein
MTNQDESIYEFGEFQLKPAEHLLLRDGKPLSLTNKAFHTLLVLVQRRGHLVEKSELINAVWGETFVEEGNLAVTISMLRKVLGDNRNEHRYIETVAKQGYRFVPEVRKLNGCEPDSVVTATDLVTASISSHSPPVKSAFPIVRAGLAILIIGIIVGLASIHFASSAARPEIRSMAIIPFQTLGPDSNMHVGVGIADDLVTTFGGDGGIEVRPLSTVMEYSNGLNDPLTVGRTQQVDAVLSGTVQNTDGEFHVTAKITRVRDNSVLWDANFDRPVGQIVDLENQLEESASRSLFPYVVKSVRSASESRNPEAYHLYLEGRYFWNKRTEDGLHRSIEYFQRAVLKDQGYAQAYAGLADSYTLLASYGVEPEQEAYPNAKDAALKALQLNPVLAEAHTSLGMVSFYYEWDWRNAETEFQRAIDLNPNYSMARTWYALELAATGQSQRALEQAQRGFELDPLSLVANTELGRVYYWDRQYDKAVASYKRAIDLDPYFSRAHTRLGITYAAQNKYADAIIEFKKVAELSGPDPYLDGLTGYAQARNGNTVAARRILDDLTQRSKRDFVPAFSVALVCIGLGDREQAMNWLEKSYLDRSTYMVYSGVDPLLDGVRSDPRFSALMTKLGFTQTGGKNGDPGPAISARVQQASGYVK